MFLPAYMKALVAAKTFSLNYRVSSVAATVKNDCQRISCLGFRDISVYFRSVKTNKNHKQVFRFVTNLFENRYFMENSPERRDKYP